MSEQWLKNYEGQFIENGSEPKSRLWRRLRGYQSTGQLEIVQPWASLRPVSAPKLADSCASCGVWPLSTGQDDPLLPACQWHDMMYTQQEQGQLPPDWTREKADSHFFRAMAILCHNAPTPEAEAKLWNRAAFYILAVNQFGGIFW